MVALMHRLGWSRAILQARHSQCGGAWPVLGH